MPRLANVCQMYPPHSILILVCRYIPHPPLDFRLFDPPPNHFDCCIILVIYFEDCCVDIKFLWHPQIIKMQSCHRRLKRHNGGRSAQIIAIPRLYCPNPRQEAPQQPFGWCLSCIGWVVNGACTNDLFSAGLCCDVDFAPQTAAIKMSRGDNLRLYVLQKGRLVGALGRRWFRREEAEKIGRQQRSW